MSPCRDHPESTERSRATCRRRRWLAIVATALTLVSGCGTSGGGRGNVDQLHLLTIPVAINFDNVAGADGFAIKVYASRASDPKPVAIPRGTVEILMYNGVVRASDLATTKPLRTWSFSGDTLRDRQYRTSIGIGYQFALGWGEAKPAADRVTVVARHLSPEGPVISSLPSSIVTNIQ